MWFLIALALIWLAIAVVCDIKKREVPNWLNFSLLLFALTYRAFYSIFETNYLPFLFGLLGFAIFFILANIFYYSRIFAGGDAKLLIALGPIVPLANTLKNNLILLLDFILLLLIVGAVYGLFSSFILIYRNKKNFSKEFLRQFKKFKKFCYLSVILAVIILLFAIFAVYKILIILSALVFVYPYLFVYAKAIEESCMIKKINVGQLSEGDWLHKPIKVGKKTIKPSWDGLSNKELDLIKKNYKGKKIEIKQGIPFIPVFFIAFILFIILWYSRWNFYQFF